MYNNVIMPKSWLIVSNSTGAEVGIAWMSQVCNTGSIRSSATGEYTSGTGVSSISKLFFFFFEYLKK